MSAIKFTHQPLILTVTGEQPTLPSPADLTPDDSGWDETSNILVGQFAYNTIDDVWYYRGSTVGIQEFQINSGTNTLYNLSDTNISSPVSGSILKFNTTSNKWEDIKLLNILDGAGNGLIIGDTSTTGNVDIAAQGLDATVDINLIAKSAFGKVMITDSVASSALTMDGASVITDNELLTFGASSGNVMVVRPTRVEPSTQTVHLGDNVTGWPSATITNIHLGADNSIGTTRTINTIGTEANIGISFEPKGTGVITTTSAHTTNISGNDDLITKGYADSNYSKKSILGNNNEILMTDGNDGIKTIPWFSYSDSGLNVVNKKIINLYPAMSGTDGANKDNIKIQNAIFDTKKYSSTSEYISDFAKLDIPDLSISGYVSGYAHVGFPIMDYNPINGNILVLTRNAQLHETSPTFISSKLSTDGGITFGASAEVLPISSGFSYLGPNGGYTSTGRFIYMYEKYPIGNPNLYYIYSDNDGVSWSNEQTISGFDSNYSRQVTGSNHIIEFDDGSIASPFYSVTPSPDVSRRWGVIFSRDGGSTFDEIIYSNVQPEGIEWGEPSIVKLADGIVLCLIRDASSIGTARTFQYISYDYCKTWQYQGQLQFDYTTGGSVNSMMPKVTNVNIFGTNVIVLYYTKRQTNEVKRIFALPKNLIGTNGHLGWNVNTLTTFHTWTLGQTVDGNGGSVHPNGNYRGIYSGEDQSSNSLASTYIFQTPNDIEDVAEKLGIQKFYSSLNGEGVPDFTPYMIGQLYTNTLTGEQYIANGIASTTDWNLLGGGVGTLPSGNDGDIIMSDGASGGKTDANFKWTGTALAMSTTNNNINIGKFAGENITTGAGNSFIGDNAGHTNTTASNCTFIGYTTGENSNAANCTFIGSKAGYANVSGTNNMFLGLQAGYKNISGVANVFIGVNAGYNNTASDNTFIGTYCGQYNTSGTYNTFIGQRAGYKNTTSDNNTAIGHNAGYTNSTGANNTYIGTNAGYLNVGTGNVFIGYNAGYNYTGSNKLYIANNSTTTLMEGDFQNGTVTINNVLNLTPLASAPSSPILGTIYVNSTDNHIYFYNGSTWIQLDN